MDGHEGSHSVAPKLPVPSSLHRFAAGSESGGVIHLFPRLSCRPCGRAVGVPMARSCADLLPPGASIPRPQCFPAMGVTVTAAFCWRDGPAGFLPVGEGPLTVPVARLRGFPALQRDHCRLKGAMSSPKAYLVVLLFPGMSYHPRHTCMAIRWHKNAIGTSPGLEPGSLRQFSAKPRRPPWAEGPPSRGG